MSIPFIRGGYVQVSNSDVAGLIRGANGGVVTESGSAPYLLKDTTSPVTNPTPSAHSYPMVITKISAGQNFSCALTPSKEVKCW